MSTFPCERLPDCVVCCPSFAYLPHALRLLKPGPVCPIRSSPPDAPTVEDASIVSNCTAGDNTLRVFISGPGYNGSSLTKPFAEGHIVKYVVTAVPETGTTIETEGAGVLQPSGWVRAGAGGGAPAFYLCSSPAHRIPGATGQLLNPLLPPHLPSLAGRAELPQPGAPVQHDLQHHCCR